MPPPKDYAFECCLNYAVRDIDLLSFDHLYHTTVHCKEHLNGSYEKVEYLSKALNALMSNGTISCEKDICKEKTSGLYNAYVVFWIILIIIGFIGNMLVIVAFAQTKSLRKSVTNFFVTSLAMSDLLLVLFIMPIKIHQALHNQRFCAPLIVCRLFYTTDVTFFVASILNLFAVTCDRFIAITMPYSYQKIMKPLHARITICLVWFCAFVWGLMLNYNDSTGKFDAVYVEKDACKVQDKDMFYVFNYSLVFFVPSVIMLVLYGIILRISILHAKHIDETRFPRRGSNESNKRFQNSARFFSARRLEFRAAKLVCIVYGTFILCWLPVTVLTLMHISRSVKTVPHLLVIFIGEILPLANSVMNPFIYGVLHRDFKKSLKKLLGINAISEKRKFKNRKRSNDCTRLSHTRCSYISWKSHTDSPMSRRPSTLDTPRTINEETFDESLTPRLPEETQPTNYTDCRKSSSSDESNKSLSSEEAVKYIEEKKPLMNNHS